MLLFSGDHFLFPAIGTGISPAYFQEYGEIKLQQVETYTEKNCPIKCFVGFLNKCFKIIG